MGKPRPPPHASQTYKDGDDDDDEEIDEDEAFNSDDERKYGSFFEGKSTKRRDDEDEDEENEEDEDGEESDSDNDSDDEEEEEEDDGGQYMLDMLSNLDQGQHRNNPPPDTATNASPHIPESPFAASVIPNAQLTLDSLMEGLKDTEGFGTIQKTMKQVAKGQATPAPLAKVVSDRVQRKVHYEIQSKEISLWSQAVQENRHAETLDFRPPQRLEVTRDMMMDQFVPTGDYETEIHAALLAQEQDELNQHQKLLQQREDALEDDLGTNTITMEEYKKRHGQLAKMRALMFYHEQKRHHMNKIKSKKYRKIRKKQKERRNEAELDAQLRDDPDHMVRELQETEELARMQERATLAHRNTSAWAKRILKRGKHVDVETRRALSAQLQRGEDLRQRMTGGQNEESDPDDDDNDWVAQARQVAGDTEPPDTTGAGLFQLAFMKKGMAQQRERVQQEARQLLMELEEDDDDDGPEHRDFESEETQRRPKRPKTTASAIEMATILKDNALMVESLQRGTASTVTTSGNIDIVQMSSHPSSKSRLERHEGDSHEASTVENVTTLPISSSSQKKKRTSHTTTTDATFVAHDASNPWLATVAPPTTKLAPPPAKFDPSIPSAKKINRLFVDIDRAVDLLEDKPIPPHHHDKVPDTTHLPEETPNSIEPNITTLTQEELVKRAFATHQEQNVNNDDDDDSFAKEKARIEEEEDPTRRIRKEKEMKVSKGWGEWAGEGVKAPGSWNMKKLNSLPKKLQPPPPPAQPTNKRQRADAKKPNVIISEKRISKLADKYMIKTVPYPYTTREEYERSMQGGIGREWNVTDSVKDLTRPEIYARAGKIIQPLSKKVKQVRTPAKF